VSRSPRCIRLQARQGNTQQVAARDRAQVRRAVQSREVLLRVLASRKGILSFDTRIDSGLPCVMEDRHLRQMPDFPAGAPEPQA
jgi:hypothetical protein